ncbi:MAG: substrate-binding domain-containing protein [Pseudonocardiaceae bacterium]
MQRDGEADLIRPSVTVLTVSPESSLTEAETYTMVPRTSLAALAAVLTITGCTGGGAFPSRAIADSARPASKVGVIVSNPAGSMRWEAVDQPLLNDAIGAAGLEPDVENSEGDATKFAAIADSMIKEGVKVLVIAAPNSQAGAAVARKATARRIPTIDYADDRPLLGGCCDYSISFDPRKAGDLQGRGLTLGIRGARARGTAVIELDGPPVDPTTSPLAQGAGNVLRPRYDTGAYRLVARASVTDNQSAGAVFERLLTASGGRVDGVLATNDGVAGAVIAVLRKKGLNGKVRVTGMGATPEALQAILRGDQFMTVFVSPEQQATTVAALSAALARNDRAAADKLASTTVADPIGHRTVRVVLLPPVFITLNTVKQVIDSGLVSYRDICDSDLALRCDQLNIPR